MEADTSYDLGDSRRSECSNGARSDAQRNQRGVRNAYVEDSERGLARWNRLIERAGHSYRLRLPSARFRRTIGSWAGVPADLDGNIIEEAAFEAKRDEWLPSQADRAFVASLMQPVTEIGQIAGWIAPPERGIKGLPFDYEYVRRA